MKTAREILHAHKPVLKLECWSDVEKQILQAMEEYSAQFNKPPVYGQWIDVKERKPEVDKLVILIEDEWVCAGYLSEDGQWYNQFECAGDPPVCCTHWIPLPPSPGSVDVEEKKECKCERDDCWQDSDGDIHCNKKIDGLGDSSGSEKEFPWLLETNEAIKDASHTLFEDDGKVENGICLYVKDGEIALTVSELQRIINEVDPITDTDMKQQFIDDYMKRREYMNMTDSLSNLFDKYVKSKDLKS